MEFFFNGILRMDWGYGNPNKTAALIVVLILSSWILPYFRRSLFWISYCVTLILLIFLVKTFSRGGLVSFGVGVLPIILFAPRPWSFLKVSAVVSLLIFLIAIIFSTHAYMRVLPEYMLNDKSIQNRISLWTAAPSMIVDSAHGWGAGRAGEAYCMWYQSPEKHERYRTLVNSHLTWLVEFGWGFRYLYIFGWLTVFVLCAPTKSAPWLSVPIGIWTGYFLSCVFSSVGEEALPWIPPLVFLLLVILWRIRSNRWANIKVWSTLLLVTLFCLGALKPIATSGGIQATPGAVIFGKGSPSVWIIVDREVIGSMYGVTLRQSHLVDSGITIGFIEDPKEMSADLTDCLVVLSGKHSSALFDKTLRQLPNAGKIVILNPSTKLPSYPLPEAIRSKTHIFVGSLNQGYELYSWRASLNVNILEGSAIFISDWPDLIWKVLWRGGPHSGASDWRK